jgi:hypothetical protein
MTVPAGPEADAVRPGDAPQLRPRHEELHPAHHGEAVQVDPIKPKLKAPGTKRLKLKYDELLSTFAFKINSRRYTMETFMRAEAEAFHQIQLVPNSPVPIFAHFENFSAQLNHPKGVINPVSTNLQSTFLTCHAQAKIHRRSPRTCPPAPKIMDDIVGYISRQSLEFEQPGDTSCPQQEQMDAMKLEVQLRTVMVLGRGLRSSTFRLNLSRF